MTGQVCMLLTLSVVSLSAIVKDAKEQEERGFITKSEFPF
jgi:hypothetical protein